MHQRPGVVSQPLRIAGGHLPGGLAIAHEAEQGLKTALGGGRALGIIRLFPGRVEHGCEMLWPA
jgi:hypothetical protein